MVRSLGYSGASSFHRSLRLECGWLWAKIAVRPGWHGSETTVPGFVDIEAVRPGTGSARVRAPPHLTGRSLEVRPIRVLAAGDRRNRALGLRSLRSVADRTALARRDNSQGRCGEESLGTTACDSRVASLAVRVCLMARADCADRAARRSDRPYPGLGDRAICLPLVLRAAAACALADPGPKCACDASPAASS